MYRDTVSRLRLRVVIVCITQLHSVSLIPYRNLLEMPGNDSYIRNGYILHGLGPFHA